MYWKRILQIYIYLLLSDLHQIGSEKVFVNLTHIEVIS